MPQTLTITASKANTTKAIEYSRDGGTTWQNSNVFTGVPAGVVASGQCLARLVGTAITSAWNAAVTVSGPTARLILAHGNSQVEGNYPGADAGEVAVGGKYPGWPNQLYREMNSAGWNVKNHGHSGWPGQYLIDTYPTEIRPLKDNTAGVENWYIWQELANSAEIGETAQQMYQGCVDACTLAKADGFKVGVITGYPRSGNFGQEYNDRVAAANTLIKANYAQFADVVFDVRSAACLLDTARLEDWRISFDRTHLSYDGNTLVAKLVKKGILQGSGIVTLTAQDFTLPSAVQAPTPTITRNTTTGDLTVAADAGFALTEVWYREDSSNGFYDQVPANGLVPALGAGSFGFFYRYAQNRIWSRPKGYPVDAAGPAVAEPVAWANFLNSSVANGILGRTPGSGEGWGSSGATGQTIQKPANGHTTYLTLPAITGGGVTAGSNVGVAPANNNGSQTAITYAIRYNQSSIGAAYNGTSVGTQISSPGNNTPFGAWELRFSTDSAAVTTVELWCVNPGQVALVHTFAEVPTFPLLVCAALYSDGTNYGRSLVESATLKVG
jgi:lysophospholipase L1-like esterase